MSSKLTLYNGPTSPFGRKVKVASLVQQINIEEKIINVYEANFLDKHNPLRKIPTLIVDNLTIMDSDNICLYFESISRKKSLYPKENYWQIMTNTSIANGLMETILERFMEISRPEGERSLKFIEKLETRALKTINWLEKNLNNFHDKKLSIDKIAIACALEYTMFRFTNDWQKENKNLNIWLTNFQKNDFMQLTKPKIS
tara:strand:+ start:86 stop:685 length:600 start_codon:yes stop_codon:yes gene_type:complete